MGVHFAAASRRIGYIGGDVRLWILPVLSSYVEEISSVRSGFNAKGLSKLGWVGSILQLIEISFLLIFLSNCPILWQK